MPDGSKASYDAANYWKDFKKIVEVKLGDVNGNGGLDIGDAVTIVNILVGKTTSTSQTVIIDSNEREPQ